MYDNTRPPIEGARTLPARYYIDPDHFERELERIHLEMWLHVGRSQEVAQTGDYVLVDVAGQSAIVVRSPDGLRAFHNVCRHRGTRLCTAPAGTLPGAIQCPYHAWTYGLDGTLVGAPHMEKVRGFTESDYPLHQVAVDEWDGHIFLNFSEAPLSLASHLAQLPERFRSWGMADLRLAHRTRYELRANWKLVIQNYSECLHCPIIHPLLNRHSHYMSGDNEPPQPTYLGGVMDLRDGVETLTMDGSSPWGALPGLDEGQRRRVYYYAILPNLLLNLHPDYMLTFALWPRACDRTDIVCEWHFHPDAMARDDFDPTPAVDFWDLTNRQDWQVSELAQQGIGSSAYAPGPYSNREELLYAFDRFVVDRTSG